MQWKTGTGEMERSGCVKQIECSKIGEHTGYGRCAKHKSESRALVTPSLLGRRKGKSRRGAELLRTKTK